jgi:hypothetical protein
MMLAVTFLPSYAGLMVYSVLVAKASQSAILILVTNMIVLHAVINSPLLLAQYFTIAIFPFRNGLWLFT